MARSRARGVNATGRSGKTERHVRLTHFLLGTAAWRSLDPVARALLLEVVQRFNGHNNGSIGLGVREAGAALHVRPHRAGQAFADLVARGFLVMARGSSFNQKKLTREWRVTFLPVGDFQVPTSRPTNEYVHWRPAEVSHHSERPPAEQAVKKQKPVSIGSTHSVDRDTQTAVRRPKPPLQCRSRPLSAPIPDPHSVDLGHTSSYQIGGEGVRRLSDIIPAILGEAA